MPLYVERDWADPAPVTGAGAPSSAWGPGFVGFEGEGTACNHCKKPRARGARALMCGGCRQVPFCSPACLRAAWPTHKLVCVDCCKGNKAKREMRAKCAGAKAAGGGGMQANSARQWQWFLSIPGLLDTVLCMAWQNRGEFPIVFVSTARDGTDARAPKLRVVPRSEWITFPGNLSLEARFVDPESQHYVSFEDVLHPGSENWPKRGYGLVYLNPNPTAMTTPEYMDFLVKVQSNRVRLTGLRRATHLNGLEGIYLCEAPGNSERCVVQVYADDSEVYVRRENVVPVQPVRIEDLLPVQP